MGQLLQTKRIRVLSAWYSVFMSFSFAISANAAIPPEKVRVSESKKTQNYLKDGVFTGGDQAISRVSIKDIRRAPNSGFERIVIDLESFIEGEPVTLARAPYFQVAVSPEERRLTVSIWGDPQLRFDPKKISKNFQKSTWISGIELLPKMETELWTFVLNLKNEASVEVFELKDPSRIILDIKPSSPAHSASK